MEQRDTTIETIVGDCREVVPTLPAGSVQTIVTSPPYWRMRSYTTDPREIGHESSPAAFVAELVAVFAHCRRVLRPDGTLWVVIGDAYANDGKWGGATSGKHTSRVHGTTGPGRRKVRTGLPPKSLVGLPWRFALAMQDAGWTLRAEIIWEKPTVMPERVRDRPTRSHEQVFLFAQSSRYVYDADAIAEPSQQQHRPQYERACALAQQHGLTDAHRAALRAVGLSDTGKALRNQAGTGRNRAEVQRLADEARHVLGGYAREFLTPSQRNARTVWRIPASPITDAHDAPMPLALAARCIRAGSRRGDLVLDPFAGSGTTLCAALALGRRAIGIDLGFVDVQARRLHGVQITLDGWEDDACA